MPETFNLVTLRGYFDLGLTLEDASNEEITLELPDIVIDTDDGRIRLPQKKTFKVSQLATGVEIAATDDVNANPQQWYYLLTESWSNRKNVPILIPSAAPIDPVTGKRTWDYWRLAAAASTGNVVIPTIVRRVNGIAPDADGDIVIPIPTGGGGGEGGPATPTGPAGGVLSGTYPDPGFAVDMATQAELNAAMNVVLKPRGPWVASTAYNVNDVVIYTKAGEPAGSVYRCYTAHTSTSAFDFGKFEDMGPQTGRADFRYHIRPWAVSVQYAQYQPARRPEDGALVVAKNAHTSGSTYDGTLWDVIATGGGTGTAGPSPETPVAKTASHVLTLTDAYKLLEVDSASNASVTFPPHSLVPIPVGAWGRIRQMGSTPVIASAGAGVTLRTPLTTRTRGKLYTFRWYKRSEYEFVLSEELAEVVPPPRQASPVTVTFSTVSHAVDAVKTYGYAVTGYTSQQVGDIRYATGLQQSSNKLAAGTYRLGFKWNAAANKPYNGAHGGINDAAGADAWVAGINAAKIAGATIVGLIEGEEEMNATPAEAASIVQYAVANSWPIEAWVIGNEPELNTSKIDYLGRSTNDGRTYGDLFCRLGAAIKAVAPTAKLWGPAASAFAGKARIVPADATSPGAMTQFFNDFLNATGAGTSVAALLDGLCWHKYLSGNTGSDVSTATLMGKTADHYGEVLNAKALIAAMPAYSAKAATMVYSLNEWNIFYRPDNGRTGVKDENGTWYDERPQTAEGAVFAASALRNSLRTTNHRFVFFGDMVGPLGLWTRNPWDLTTTPPLLGDNMGPGGLLHYPHGKPAHTPYAPYWGMAMYTGAAMGIRRFGANIATLPGHGITNLEVIASTDNGGDVILINKDEGLARRINLTTVGVTSGAADVWQTQRWAPWDAPTKVASLNIVQTKQAVTGPPAEPAEGRLADLILPPMTVTRVVINP